MKTTSGIEIDTDRIKQIIIDALELSEDDAKKFRAYPYENRLYKGGCGTGQPILDKRTTLSRTGMASAMYANILKRYRMLEPHNYHLVDNFYFFNTRSNRFGDAYNAVVYTLNKEHKLIK